MKLELDKKDKIATITLQHINDLFYLYLLIERDDEVLGWTFRQKKVSNAGQQIRGEKERVYLGIKVNKVYFHPFTDTLKIIGFISLKPEEMELGGHYHSFNVKVGDTIKLKKEDWDSVIVKSILKKIKEVYPTTMIISVEYTNIAVALLTSVGLKTLFSKNEEHSGKRHYFDREKLISNFLEEVSREIKNLISLYNPDVIILYGPGNIKDRLYNEMKSKTKTIFRITGSIGGVEGIYEALRNEAVLKSLSTYSDYEDIFVLNKIQENPEKVAIGIDEIKRAAEYGAIDKLIISTEYLKSLEKDKLDEIKKIGEIVVAKGGLISLVYSNNEMSSSLSKLGNILALLRYQLAFPE